MRTGKNIRLRKDGRYEARYEKARDEAGHIIYGYCYGQTYEEAEEKRNWKVGKTNSPREMNLLILGAGVLGTEVKELAETLRVFNRIDFLEDFGNNAEAIGKCLEAKSFLDEYPIAIPAVGDNELRKKWFFQLKEAGFVIPTLIHPGATISHGAKFGAGSIICAGVTIGANVETGYSCVISSGATVKRNVNLPNWSLVDYGETIV